MTAPEPRLSGRSDPPDALAVELARLDRLLAMHLSALRNAGRSTLGDAVGGAVIEDGEAEGLLASLHETHMPPGGSPASSSETWTSPLPALERAREIFGLSAVERDVLLLALAVEIDSRYARLVAFLNDHVAMTRPTLGLAMALFVPDHDRARAQLLERIVGDSPFSRFGLLRLEGDGPVANRALQVPDSFWPRLVGLEARVRFAPVRFERDCDEFVMAETLVRQIDAVGNWLRTQPPGQSLVIVSGQPGSGRDVVAQLIGAGMTRCNVVVDARHDKPDECLAEIARECQWHQACAIIRHAHKAPATFHRQCQRQLSGPVVYVTESPHDGQLLDLAARPCAEINVPPLDPPGRIRIWEHLSRRHAIEIDAPSLASRFGFGPGRIDRALSVARTISGMGGGDGDIGQVCRKMQRAKFDGLAAKLPCPFDEADIVLPGRTRHELDLICTWARHGHRLFGADGLGRRLHTGTGLVCLFSGPPGTGKTMAAQVIARRIGFDVYRIDLSQVVNKYVGETEKNLARVFNEAQRSKVILFFDEAETLFGDRSEVKSAQDRFANIEIGYLLQRIETFEGVAILATNLQKNLDEAFLRRLNVTADFPIPGAEERHLIWTKLLPPAAERAADVDLDLLSRQFRIAGGDIRNAIFSALLLAAEEQQQIGMSHLVRGLWRELQKSGRVVDTAQFGAWRDLVSTQPAT